MNGQHVLFKPEPWQPVPMPPHIADKLKKLREEFAAMAAQIRRVGHPLGK